MLRLRTLTQRTHAAAAAAALPTAARGAALAALPPPPRSAIAAPATASAVATPGRTRWLHNARFLRNGSSDKSTDAPAGTTPPSSSSVAAEAELAAADAPVRQSLAAEEGEEDEVIPPEEEDEDALLRDEGEEDDTAPAPGSDEVPGSDEINELLGGGDDGEDGLFDGEDDTADPAADEEDVPEPARQNLRPSELVSHLDKYIVGQFVAKKSVAVALRNRWRRHSVRPSLRQDITPKNILMVGPTGCGKTEIARRLAMITDSPFIKVEATKFTEVGFYGKDVDTIIRDLVRVAISNLKAKKRAALAKVVGVQVENALLQALHETRAKEAAQAAAGAVPGMRKGEGSSRPSAAQVAADREALRKGELDAVMVDIDVPLPKSANPFGDMLGGGGGAGAAGGAGDDDSDLPSRGGGGMGMGFATLGSMKQALGGGSGMERRRLSIGEARPLLTEHHLVVRLRTRDLAKQAIKQVESDGIVFLDEIDKICAPKTGRRSSADASDEGVQRDLLPLVEGTTVSTPHGPVQTDHILFICSGAFHKVNVADMLPELQGRLPIRVELQPLTEEDFFRILTVPKNNLIKQQQALLATDNVTLTFDEDAIREVARVSYEVNRTVENIGARRLNTVIQRVMDEHSFTAADQPAGTELRVTVDYVRERVKPMLQNANLSRFVL